MKVRHGFVSNSSASSFVIHGASIDKDIIGAKLREMHKDDSPADKQKFEEELEECGVDEFVDDLSKIIPGNLIVRDFWYEEDEVYIGRPYTSMKDNETYGEFKASIAHALKEFLGEEVAIGHIEEARGA